MSSSPEPGQQPHDRHRPPGRADERPLSVIMPLYNERLTLEEIVGRVLESPWVGQLIIVDDGSTDGSADLLRERVAPSDDRILALFHADNRGKGAAIQTAQPHVARRFVVIQDADLEYDPSEYHRLLGPLLDGNADVVYGSRFRGDVRRVLFFWHALGNHLITLLSNAFTNLNLTDVETCYKAFRSEVFKSLPLRSRRFGFEPEITAKVARLGLRLYEVPISYHGRTYAEGKKIGWKDGVQALWVILREALFPYRGEFGEGQETLEAMRGLQRYHRFLWDAVEPWAGEHVLEVGAGIGNVTQHIQRHRHVWATDAEPGYLELLERRFENRPSVEVTRLDLTEPLGPDNAADLAGRPDTVLSFNVLEHIEDDATALAAVHELLADGGHLLLLVPAGPALHGPLDERLGHYRRYRRDELLERMRRAGFEVLDCSAVNGIGALGWWLNVRVLRRARVPRFQARLNDWLVPWLRLERRLGLPFGLSWVVVARKPTG